MPPFSVYPTAIDGIKDRIESIAVQGDRLFMGTGTGDLHIYALRKESGDERPAVTLLETKKSFTRKSIDQLGFIRDTNSLIVLSDSNVTLYALPGLSPVTPLAQTKGAVVFALNTSVVYLAPDGREHDAAGGPSDARDIPTVITHLVVGCRKRVVIFSWRDGEAQETKETALPHTPRAIAFPNENIVCLAYSQNENVLLSLETMTPAEISLPNTNSVSVASLGMGMGALSGLSGYMTLGYGVKAKPSIVKVNEGEVLIPKDGSGIFVGSTGQPTRPFGIDWPAAPEENTYIKPYVLSVLPAGTVPIKQASSSAGSQASHHQSSVLQATSSISLLPVQLLTPPFDDSVNPPPRSSHNIRLLTLPTNAKPPLFFLTTPIDKNVAAAEGSTLWMLLMRSWSEQVDELVDSGSYAQALALLDTVDRMMLPDKDLRRNKIRTLHAVSHFAEGQFDEAINTFIELDVNPAKVIALYPEPIAGRLATPKEKWYELHGGKTPPGFAQVDTEEVVPSPQDSPTVAVVETADQQGWSAANLNPAYFTGKLRAGLDMLVPMGSNPKEDDTATISEKSKPAVDDFHRSVETLLRYLGDRRPKLWGALSALHISPGQASEHASLSTTSVEELFEVPNSPPPALIPDQLVRSAQIVDTALFKSYLAIRPSLLGPLCRIDNWCEVSEVENVLRSRGKYSELIFLYHGKRMHDKALDLLHEMSLSEETVKDKLSPTINYLRKLGPGCLPQIFNAARWALEIDQDLAFEIFTSEDTELPREEVVSFLEEIDQRLCARYIEYLIQEREENSSYFHDHLADLYLSLCRSEKARGNTDAEREVYSKLLKFIGESHSYQIERLFGLLPLSDMFEARAVLLGKLGKHEGALEIYVYRLQDYIKAEEYCKRVFHDDTNAGGIFLTLLRIYLQPRTSHNLLRPALDLISRHSPRLDAVETLQLLPPMVSAQELRAFLCEALRAPVFDTQVIREISKARSEQAAAKLIGLQTKRVKITDSRICPQCHKRIGNSVIAVHAPRGEVTHYTCRESFSRKLDGQKVAGK